MRLFQLCAMCARALKDNTKFNNYAFTNKVPVAKGDPIATLREDIYMNAIYNAVKKIENMHNEDPLSIIHYAGAYLSGNTKNIDERSGF